jgi:hypothetical protein
LVAALILANYSKNIMHCLKNHIRDKYIGYICINADMSKLENFIQKDANSMRTHEIFLYPLNNYPFEEYAFVDTRGKRGP